METMVHSRKPVTKMNLDVLAGTRSVPLPAWE